ncbi:MAG: EAL domain-containing protein [Acidimicrobiia bacterium]
MERAGSATLACTAPSDMVWDRVLVKLLTGEGVDVVFQPIVDLQRVRIAGYEALSRFSIAPDCSPDKVFAAAAVRGLVPELEAVTVRAALARRDDLPPKCFLALNLEPESLVEPATQSVLADFGSLNGVVVEVTEHRRLPPADLLDPVLERLRHAGAVIAMDNAGTGLGGLRQILQLRPGILKIDHQLVRGIDADPARQALVEMIGVFANRVDAWLLTEGVETAGEARTLVELGVPFAQGFLFARPDGPWPRLDPAVEAALRQHRLDFSTN